MAEQEPHIGKSPEKTPFELAVEESTGRSLQEIRDTPIDVMRADTEKRLGKPIQFVSYWPFIGRKESSSMLSRIEINTMLDEVLSEPEDTDFFMKIWDEEEKVLYKIDKGVDKLGKAVNKIVGKVIDKVDQQIK